VVAVKTSNRWPKLLRNTSKNFSKRNKLEGIRDADLAIRLFHT